MDTLGDCAPNDANIHPGSTELCNGIDDNCDGNVDEGIGINAPPNSDTWYYDLDGDGDGNALNTILACTPPIGTVSNMDDCNDTNSNVYLGADEYCNGIDDDCDGELDESAVDMTSYYLDLDLDGHGDPTTIVSFCPVLENNQFVHQLVVPYMEMIVMIKIRTSLLLQIDPPIASMKIAMV